MFPYEYQRVLRQMKEEKIEEAEKLPNGNEVIAVNGHHKSVTDIEDAIPNGDIQQKKLELILDKTR